MPAQIRKVLRVDGVTERMDDTSTSLDRENALRTGVLGRRFGLQRIEGSDRANRERHAPRLVILGSWQVDMRILSRQLDSIPGETTQLTLPHAGLDRDDNGRLETCTGRFPSGLE